MTDYMVFDVVSENRAGIVRSAFEITRITGSRTNRILHFKKFWYPESRERYVTALPRVYPTYHPKRLGEEEVASLLTEMQLAGYREFECREIPRNVAVDDWKSMERAARKAIDHSHSCP
ncbi:MAG: hypothetical protein JRN20_23400 [Nitrososphaerota archaeon]|nr:hypothetical protein [Nitrososphaerota archaeon]